MKKTILSFALFICTAIAVKAQPAAGTVNQQKPKAAVAPVAVTVAAPATSDTASSKVSTKKQAVKRTCCRKEGMPCGNNGSSAKPKSSATKQD